MTKFNNIINLRLIKLIYLPAIGTSLLVAIIFAPLLEFDMRYIVAIFALSSLISSIWGYIKR